MTGKMKLHRGTEYLQPPPGSPTLDAKQSPLALLAQTCNLIGKDSSTSAKLPLLQKVDNSKHLNHLIRKNSLPNFSSSSSPVSVSGRSEKRGRSPLDICRSPVLTKTPTDIAVPNSFGSSPFQNNDFALSQRKLSENKKRKFTAVSSLENSEWKQSKLDRYYSAQASLSSASASSPLSISSVCSQQNSSASSNSKFSPPPQKRMSLCDPCCGMRRESPTNLEALDALKSTQLPFLSLNAAATTYPWYAQMLMAATRDGKLNADSSPHVCHWVSSSTGNCGKRFSTSDELLVHLQTHALASASADRMSYIMNSLEKFSAPYAAYLSHQAAALAAVPPSATAGRAVLPRSRSPMEGYPFKANLLSQLSSHPSLPIAAGVGPYCSPYAFYNQRLGAAGFNYP